MSGTVDSDLPSPARYLNICPYLLKHKSGLGVSRAPLEIPCLLRSVSKGRNATDRRRQKERQAVVKCGRVSMETIPPPPPGGGVRGGKYACSAQNACNARGARRESPPSGDVALPLRLPCALLSLCRGRDIERVESRDKQRGQDRWRRVRPMTWRGTKTVPHQARETNPIM